MRTPPFHSLIWDTFAGRPAPSDRKSVLSGWGPASIIGGSFEIASEDEWRVQPPLLFP